MGTQSIFELLGLPPDVDLERLRHAYEGAVGAATARGDWKRATALSTAFDQLPRDIRVAVYPGRDRDASRWGPAPEVARRHKAPRTPGGSQARRVCAIALVGVWAIVSLLAIGTWLIHRPPTTLAMTSTARPAMSPATATALPQRARLAGRRHRQRATSHAKPVGATWSPMHALYPGSGEVRIPRKATLDARGRAQVLCPDDPTGSSWRFVPALPLQYFTCPSGYIGLVRVSGK